MSFGVLDVERARVDGLCAGVGGDADLDLDFGAAGGLGELAEDFVGPGVGCGFLGEHAGGVVAQGDGDAVLSGLQVGFAVAGLLDTRGDGEGALVK